MWIGDRDAQGPWAWALPECCKQGSWHTCCLWRGAALTAVAQGGEGAEAITAGASAREDSSSSRTSTHQEGEGWGWGSKANTLQKNGRSSTSWLQSLLDLDYGLLSNSKHVKFIALKQSHFPVEQWGKDRRQQQISEDKQSVDRCQHISEAHLVGIIDCRSLDTSHCRLEILLLNRFTLRVFTNGLHSLTC